MAPIEEIFCEVDDFCKDFFPYFERGLLPGPGARRRRAVSMSASEIMTILVLFQLSCYRDFKNFYLDFVMRRLRREFPKLLSYNRFVEIQSRVLPALCAFLKHKAGDATGLYYIDATSLKVCRLQRMRRHKTFKEAARMGKSSMGWFYGFKLHLVINQQGEIMALRLTPGNTDDRKPVPGLLKGLRGMVAGDRGYISAKLAEDMRKTGVKMITKIKKNMKKVNKTSFEKFFLSKRGLIETVIGQLKYICQIEHSRHRKPDNFLINILAALAAYALKPRKPTITINTLIPN